MREPRDTSRADIEAMVEGSGGYERRFTARNASEHPEGVLTVKCRLRKGVDGINGGRRREGLKGEGGRGGTEIGNRGRVRRVPYNGR